MQARLVSVGALSPADVSAWRALAAAALEPNPFFAPECLGPAARLLPGGDALMLAVVADGDRWLAALPVVARRSWRGFPRAVWDSRALDTAIGLGSPLLADPAPVVSPASGPPAAASHPAPPASDAAAALLRCLRDAPGAPGVLVLDWLADGPVADALRGAAGDLGMLVRTHLAWERGLLVRRPEADAWRAAIKSDRLRRLRRHARRLGERLGGEVVIGERPFDDRLVDDFLRLEASGWKGSADHGAAYARAPETQAWFREVAEAFAARGQLLALELRVGDRPVALEVCLRAGDGLFAWRVGHDAELQTHGPGAQLQVRLLQWFQEETDAGFLDSCAEGSNTFALGITPDRRAMTTTLVALGGPVDRAAVRAMPAVRRARAAVRARMRRG